MRYSNSVKTIGIFNDSYPPIMDGVSLTVQNYARCLQQKNQSVCVVAPRSPNYTDNEIFPVYRYVSLPVPTRKPYRWGIPQIDFPLQHRLRTINFGLVHAHCPFSSGNIALSIAKKRHIPLIATFHSKYRDDFERSVHSKTIAQWMTRKVVRFFEQADQVWISQPSVVETLREYGYKGKIDIVPLGNDFVVEKPFEPVKQQAREALNIPSDTVVLLFVGQIIWEKNIQLIIESLALINDLPFIMYFIGTGYAQQELQRMIYDKGLQHKVRLVGVVSDRNTLKQYYAAANLFLFPSLYDTWGLVVREAAATATPSVLIDSSTIAQSIANNVTGFFGENAPTPFANTLRELIQNPDLLKRVGENAAATMTYSWDDATEEILDRYKKLMEKWTH